MKYEELIRKIFKKYKSKRELKKELDIINHPISMIKDIGHYNVETVKSEVKIDRDDINYLNEQERNIQIEKIMYDLKVKMFDYLYDSNLIKIRRQINHYENTEEFIAFLKIVIESEVE